MAEFKLIMVREIAPQDLDSDGVELPKTSGVINHWIGSGWSLHHMERAGGTANFYLLFRHDG